MPSEPDSDRRRFETKARDAAGRLTVATQSWPADTKWRAVATLIATLDAARQATFDASNETLLGIAIRARLSDLTGSDFCWLAGMLGMYRASVESWGAKLKKRHHLLAVQAGAFGVPRDLLHDWQKGLNSRSSREEDASFATSMLAVGSVMALDVSPQLRRPTFTEYQEMTRLLNQRLSDTLANQALRDSLEKARGRKSSRPVEDGAGADDLRAIVRYSPQLTNRGLKATSVAMVVLALTILGVPLLAMFSHAKPEDGGTQVVAKPIILSETQASESAGPAIPAEALPTQTVLTGRLVVMETRTRYAALYESIGTAGGTERFRLLSEEAGYETESVGDGILEFLTGRQWRPREEVIHGKDRRVEAAVSYSNEAGRLIIADYGKSDTSGVVSYPLTRSWGRGGGVRLSFDREAEHLISLRQEQRKSLLYAEEISAALAKRLDIHSRDMEVSAVSTEMGAAGFDYLELGDQLSIRASKPRTVTRTFEARVTATR